MTGRQLGQSMTHSGLYFTVFLFAPTKIYFRVEDEDKGYLLNIGGYFGTAGDSMTNGSYSVNGMKFSTHDRDNDLCSCNCAQAWTGGWWFNK